MENTRHDHPAIKLESSAATPSRPASRAGHFDGVEPRTVIEPGGEAELIDALRTAAAGGAAVIPRGGGTKLDWGNPPRKADLLLSMSKFDGVLEHAAGDMTVTVRAGTTLGHLQRVLAEKRQRLPLDALWPERATIGGAIATNDSGSLRLRFGSVRDLLLGVTIVLADGTRAKSGGKVVKNVAGYDLPKLFTGSLGTLGVVTSATLRVYPLPVETYTLSFHFSRIEEVPGLILAVHDSTLAPARMQIVAGRESPPRVDVAVEEMTGGSLEARKQTLAQLGKSFARETAPAAADVWGAREQLFEENAAGSAVICRLSTLPGQIKRLGEEIIKQSTIHHFNWRLVMQSVGLGTLRLEISDPAIVVEILTTLRRVAEMMGGSLAILRCPLFVKEHLDVWGSAGDALDLMRRIKGQFDPGGVLNPNRFIGGI